jgi:hypothetical protein
MDNNNCDHSTKFKNMKIANEERISCERQRIN